VSKSGQRPEEQERGRMLPKIKWIKSKFEGLCHNCKCRIYTGDTILWHAELKEKMCKTCGDKFFEWLEKGRA
jgi:hypothetical protein